MPKLNLQTAIRIKGQGGEFAAIKGPGGILWLKPVVGGAPFKVQHFNPAVPVGGGSQAIEEVGSLDAAFVITNSNNRMGAGPSTSTSGNRPPDELGLQLQLTSTTAVGMTVQGGMTQPNLSSFSVWEYIGPSGGDDEFIVRDRRTITLSSTNSESFTPAGIVNANKCVVFLSSRSDRGSSSQYDHAMAGAYINRSTGEVTVEGRGGDGVHVIEATTVEFTGAAWTVHYGTNNTSTGDTGTINLDGSVGDWANAFIIHNFYKNGGGNGAIADSNAMYFPPTNGDLDAVSYQFDGNHDATTGQRHTVFVLEHAGMTVTRYRQTHGTGPLTADDDISALGITDLGHCLVQISAESSGSGSAHGRGHRIAYFVDENTVRNQAHRTGNGMNIETQVVQLPETITGGGGTPSTPSDFAIQHFTPNVPEDGDTQEVVTVSSLDRAFIWVNHSLKMAIPTTALDTDTVAPDEAGVIFDFDAVDNITMTRQGPAALAMNPSFSVLEYVGDPGGANEFIVRDRRIVTLDESNPTVSFTPAGIVNADKCIVVVEGVSSTRPNSSNWDHACAGVAINRTNGQVTVMGRGTGPDVDDGVLTVSVATIELTGSDWTVHYATDNTATTDNGTLTLTGSVGSWNNAAILSNFGKNGGGEGGASDVAPTYVPGGALNEVNWSFNTSHAPVAGQQHTVFVIENPNLTVSRFSDTQSPGEVTGNIDISSLALADRTKALLYITTTCSGTGSTVMRGARGIRFVDADNIQHFTNIIGGTVAINAQVIEFPNVGDSDPGDTSPPPASGLPALPVYDPADFTVTNAANGADLQGIINGFGSDLSGRMIKLAAGNYDAFAIDKVNQGEASSAATPFVIQGPDVGTATINQNTGDDTVFINGASHIVIDGLTIEGAQTDSKAAFHCKTKANTADIPVGVQLINSTIQRRQGDGCKWSEVIDALVDTCDFVALESTSGERHNDFNKFENATLVRCTFTGERAINAKGGSKNLILRENLFTNCVNTVEIGEAPGSGYWTRFDGERNWSVLNAEVADNQFDNCTGNNIKFKDVHDAVCDRNGQVSSGPGSTDATYQYLNGKDLGQSTYENSNIVVDGVTVIPAI